MTAQVLKEVRGLPLDIGQMIESYNRYTEIIRIFYSELLSQSIDLKLVPYNLVRDRLDPIVRQYYGTSFLSFMEKLNPYYLKRNEYLTQLDSGGIEPDDITQFEDTSYSIFLTGNIDDQYLKRFIYEMAKSVGISIDEDSGEYDDAFEYLKIFIGQHGQLDGFLGPNASYEDYIFEHYVQKKGYDLAKKDIEAIVELVEDYQVDYDIYGLKNLLRHLGIETFGTWYDGTVRLADSLGRYQGVLDDGDMLKLWNSRHPDRHIKVSQTPKLAKLLEIEWKNKIS